MTARRDIDTILAAWLDEGPTDLPDATRRAIVTALPMTSQARRGPFAPWRLDQMNSLGRLGAVALVAVVTLVAALYFLGRRDAVGPATPSVSPAPSLAGPVSPSASQAASAAPTRITIPVVDATFVSPRHGYTISYPSSWTTTAASSSWAAGAILLWGDPALDDLRGSDVRLVAASQEVAPKTGPDWLGDLAGETGCKGPSMLPPTVPVGPETGTVTLNGCAAAGGGIVPGGVVYDVLVVSGDRGYDFTIDGHVDAPYVLALLATVSFQPDDAVAPSASAAP